MSFPASAAFRRDARVKPPLMRVYQFLYEHLDLHEPRECKLAWIEHGTGIRRSHVSTALSTLIRWGYLIAHQTPANCPRCCTLAHSVRSDLRQAA